jgi:nuclear transport factor 2 (NTF2) superfamily protein
MNPPLPPFTVETAAEKARRAEDAWNTRDPARVVLAYTSDSRWRNRAEFLEGRDAIRTRWNGPHFFGLRDKAAIEVRQ